MVRTDTTTLYEELVRRYGADLYRLAYRLVGDASKAEDLVQEAYYHAWKSIDGLRDPAAGRAWLTTILRRAWAKGLRRGTFPGAAAGDGPDVDDTASPLPGPDLALFARRESLQRALDRLEPSGREPFLLVFLGGLSCREAAERLGIPLGTVLSRIHRARTTLRRLLQGEFDPLRARPADPRTSAGEAR